MRAAGPVYESCAALARNPTGAVWVRNPDASNDSPAGIAKIQHVVIIMQENRSFDSYFGTYPGAEGIPMTDGVPTVCLNDPLTNTCVRPYHNPKDSNHGGPHDHMAALIDIDDGRMNGFIRAQWQGETLACPTGTEPSCAEPDVMGWHDAREIPNYWSYAGSFVLQDHMFEPTTSWSLPAHLFMMSALVGNPEDES